MAHQIATGPSTSGSSKISAPLMTSPRATETKSAAPGLRMADHRHVRNAVNTRDERAAECRQKVFAVDRAHIVPEQIHGHPPRKRKKPDKEQTFQSAPYPAAVFSEQLAIQRTRVLCQKEDGLSSDAGQKTVPSSHAQNPNIFIHAWPHTPRNYWVSSSHRTKSKSSPSPSQNPNPRHTPRAFPAFEAP